jgi:adenylate cyclase
MPLSAFRQQAWDDAKQKFHRVSEISATDGPVHFYLNLCDEYKRNPPAESWDGVIALEEK